MKTLFLIRGLPGSGKTTFANTICDNVVSADDYFGTGDQYNFDPSKLPAAHRYCKGKTESIMQTGNDVAVANTFSKWWEMDDYYALAEKYGYFVFSVVVENRHGGKSIHDVPEQTIENMRKRFEVQL